MSWKLLGQLLILVVVTGLLVEAVGVAWIDKHREDDIKRKDAGL